MFLPVALLLLNIAPRTGSLQFTAPAEWKSRPPASTMRVAEFVVPKAAAIPAFKAFLESLRFQ